MTSTARLESNRRNAQRSTGPRTLGGKARSSRNATRHGLDGERVVLDGPERARLSRRITRWTADFDPRDDVERALVARAAFASVVLERIDRIEAQATREWQEKAAERFDAEDRAGVAAAIGLLDTHPDLARRALHATPTGCAWLRDRWAELAGDLAPGAPGGGWTSERVKRALRLLGHSTPEPRDTLHDACEGQGPARQDCTGFPLAGQGADLARQMANHWEAERLRQLPSFLEDRAGAIERAWLPPEAVALVTRHEPAWTRRLLRALDTLRRRQAARPRIRTPKRSVDTVFESPPAPPTAAELPAEPDAAPDRPRPVAPALPAPVPAPSDPVHPAVGTEIGQETAPSRNFRANEPSDLPAQVQVLPGIASGSGRFEAHATGDRFALVPGHVPGRLVVLAGPEPEPNSLRVVRGTGRAPPARASPPSHSPRLLDNSHTVRPRPRAA